MKHILPKTLLLFQLLLMLFVQAHAQTEVIAGWTFGTVTGEESPFADQGNFNNVGIQEITLTNANITGYVGGLPGRSITSNGWNNFEVERFWIVPVNTLGFEGLTLSSKQQSSNTGPKDFKAQYSLDGSTWIDISGADITVANNLTSGVLNKVSLPETASNKASIFIRWLNTTKTSVRGDDTGSGGTNRIDEIFIEGIALGEAPDPTSTPIINPNGGTFEEAQTVVLTSETEGASIYYTLDGSTPNLGSTLYIGTLSIEESAVLSAIAFADGFGASEVASAEFTINLPAVPSSAIPYTQNFENFVNLSSPVSTFGANNEWSISTTGGVNNYIGDFGTGNQGGFRGKDVLGYQHNASSGEVTAILILENTTGFPISDLEISYLGRVARVDQLRHPKWIVSINGITYSELTYNTAEGEDTEISAIISDLNIPSGELVTIVWSSDRGLNVTSGASRQIGLTNVKVTIPEILEPVEFVNWNFFGEPGNQVSTAGFAPVQGVEASDFTRGDDLNTNQGGNSINSSGWNEGEDRYFSFGFTVAADKLVDLTQLQIGSRSSNTGPKDMALRYSGDNFTDNLATWTNTNSRLDQIIDLSGLQNLSGTVEFRIVSISEVAVNGGTIAAGGTSRVENFFENNIDTGGTRFIGIVKEAEGVIIPSINLDPNTLDFGMVTINEAVPVLTYEITASNLTADIIINSEGPFTISADGVNFQNTITIPAGQFNNPVSISVALDSSVPGTLSSNITHQTNGAGPVNLTVSATVVDPFNISEDFNNSCPDGLPSGWTSVSLLGDQEWLCTEFGRAGTNQFANAPFGVQMNGFLSGPQLNEDWLISPAFDLSEFDFPILTFWSRANFAGPRLQLLVSTNYIDGDPAQADWTELNDRFATSNTWTFSKEINLVGFKNSNVRIAFKYRSSPEEGATRWTLDDFNLKNSDVPPAPFLTNTIGNVDYWHFGIIPVGTVSIATRTFNFSLSDALEPLTIKAVPGFEFSKNGSDFFQSLTYDPIEAAANNTVTVRFAPNDMGAFSGTIAFESGDIMIQRGFVTGATVERDNTFDIVTWNVEWFGSTQPRQGPNNVDLQLQNVKTIIEDLDADIYAFQEITGLDKFNELVELLEGYEAVVSPAASQGPDAFDDAQKLIFLYKKEVVELVKTRVLLEGVNPEDLVGYPSTPDRFWASGRLPFMMEVKANISGIQQKFNLVNVHTRSNGGGESAANPRYAMRRYDVNVLKDSLDFYYGDVPLILFGDFNDDLDETVADQTAPTVNTTETSFINYINDPENYIPVTLSLSNAGLRTFPSFENVIDHMIISNELESNWIVNSERAVAPFDLIPNYLSTTSDHLPVKARFELRCDIIAGQIIAPNEVCAESEFNLLFVGGEFTNIVAWEISTDNGMTWESIEASNGKNEITISAINASASFRVLMESNLCFAYSDVSETALVELPEPVIYFERGLLNTIQGDYTYYWYKNDVLISTTTVNATRIQGAGSYEVVIENELGCQSISETFRFPQEIRSGSVRVFPNPSSHLVTVIAKNTEGLINVELLSSAGVKINSKVTDEGYVEFNVSGLAKGVYLIVITDRNGQRTVERLLVK